MPYRTTPHSTVRTCITCTPRSVSFFCTYPDLPSSFFPSSCRVEAIPIPACFCLSPPLLLSSSSPFVQLTFHHPPPPHLHPGILLRHLSSRLHGRRSQSPTSSLYLSTRKPFPTSTASVTFTPTLDRRTHHPGLRPSHRLDPCRARIRTSGYSSTHPSILCSPTLAAASAAVAAAATSSTQCDCALSLLSSPLNRDSGPSVHSRPRPRKPPPTQTILPRRKSLLARYVP